MERSDTEPYLEGKIAEGHITRGDADLILEHLYERQAQRGISDETVRTSASYIALLRNHTPEFEQCTTADDFRGKPDLDRDRCPILYHALSFRAGYIYMFLRYSALHQ